MAEPHQGVVYLTERGDNIPRSRMLYHFFMNLLHLPNLSTPILAAYYLTGVG